MKKKQLKHTGLALNKSVISNLESSRLNGGGTNSCLIFVDTACAQTVGCNFTNACPQTNGCPTNGCPPPPTLGGCGGTISCEPIGICPMPVTP